MPGVGKRVLWLTALTTASLAVTGCSAGPTAAPAAKAPPSAATLKPSPTPRPIPSAATLPPRPSPSPAAPVVATPAPLAPVVLPRQPSVLVVSDGSSTVHVGGSQVRFPGSVTDAAVSPNGSRIAFIDGQGNVATAHLDGTAVRVLTSTDSGVRRAQPTFEDGGAEIVFSERGRDGVWRLKEVAADGHDNLTAGKHDPTVAETEHDHGHDTSPSATWFQASHDRTARSVMVFEHTANGVAKVFITDRNQRGFAATALLTGRSPAISPTGDRVAFIGGNGQIEVQTLPLTDGTPVPYQVTWRAHPVGHLAWSPDGRRLVFSTRRSVDTVASTPGAPRGNPVQVVLHHPGVGSLGTRVRPTVGVYADPDPVAAAVAVSRAHFVDLRDAPMDGLGGLGVAWADQVTLLSADDPSAAAPAAAIAAGGPLLFVRDGRLDPRVRAEILRLLQAPRRMRMHGIVNVVGTPRAVPDSIATSLQALGLRVRRRAPASAAAARAAARRGYSEAYIVVSRTDLPAVVSSVAASTPVLLTNGSSMPAATAARIDKLGRYRGHPPTVYAVGMQAQAAVRSWWAGKRSFRVVDIGGPDPYANSLDAVQSLYDAPGRVAVTTMTSWQDALISTMAGPTLVVDEGRGLETAAQDWLTASEAALRGVYVFGGSAALPETVGHTVYGDRYEVTRAPEDIRF